MKKNIIILLLLVFITGCKNKQLSCSMEKIVSENVVSYEVNANFDKNRINNMHFKMQTTVADKYIDYAHILEQEILDNYQDFQNKEGIKINTSRNNNNVILDIDIDFSIFNEELKKDLGINSDSNYKDAKKSLESSGYICN